MGRRGGVLSLAVEDNGAGCEPDQVFQGSEGGGFGLFSIRERLHMLDGSVSVRAAPGEGCRITLSLAEGQTGGDVGAPEETAVEAGRPGEPHPRGQAASGGAGEARRIRVMLADDHKIVREGLAGLLRAEQDIELVGEAENGRRAVELAEQLEPDLVVMDVSMPRMDGVRATQRIRQRAPEIRVLGLSMHVPGAMDVEMRQAGASVCLSKQTAGTDLVKIIRRHAREQTTA